VCAGSQLGTETRLNRQYFNCSMSEKIVEIPGNRRSMYYSIFMMHKFRLDVIVPCWIKYLFRPILTWLTVLGLQQYAQPCQYNVVIERLSPAMVFMLSVAADAAI
jgi:hypothetical protein